MSNSQFRLCLLYCPSALVLRSHPVETQRGVRCTHKHTKMHICSEFWQYLVSILSGGSWRTSCPRQSHRTLVSIVSGWSNGALLSLGDRKRTGHKSETPSLVKDQDQHTPSRVWDKNPHTPSRVWDQNPHKFGADGEMAGQDSKAFISDNCPRACGM